MRFRPVIRFMDEKPEFKCALVTIETAIWHQRQRHENLGDTAQPRPPHVAGTAAGTTSRPDFAPEHASSGTNGTTDSLVCKSVFSIDVRKPPVFRTRLRHDRIMNLDRDICLRAFRTRDARFDGRIFAGVLSTGIYCRPVCPARTPKPENFVFFASAAAAQDAGFRPCLRCRPETSPDLAAWNGTSNTVTRALGLIETGALDSADIDALADRLGVGARQLRRLFRQHLGASPVAVAQTRRVLLAKQLIHETKLPMTEVAMAAGFGSVRRFNETFQRLFARPPIALRRSKGLAANESGEGITLRLAYRAPFDWDGIVGFLAMRAIPGVEVVSSGSYCRVIGAAGTIAIHQGSGDWLEARIRLKDLRLLPATVSRIRRIFDLAADPLGIGKNLAEDPALVEALRRGQLAEEFGVAGEFEAGLIERGLGDRRGHHARHGAGER